MMASLALGSKNVKTPPSNKLHPSIVTSIQGKNALKMKNTAFTPGDVPKVIGRRLRLMSDDSDCEDVPINTRKNLSQIPVPSERQKRKKVPPKSRKQFQVYDDHK